MICDFFDTTRKSVQKSICLVVFSANCDVNIADILEFQKEKNHF
jgi:hypothetical protein